MLANSSRLVTLVRLLDTIPTPSLPSRRRGHPRTYPDRLFFQALLVMIVRRIPHIHGLLEMLAEPTPEMEDLRHVLSFQGQFPCRRTWERRMAALPATLEEQIQVMGAWLIAHVQPWKTSGRAVAMDSTALRARGGVWHKKHRDRGEIPHSSIDTEAAWSKSGWHGWWYGWKLHVVISVGDCWIPLAAALTEANAPDGETGYRLAQALPEEVRLILGDSHYRTEELQRFCAQTNRLLVCSRGRRNKLADDPGREVRRVLHLLRSGTIETWNEQFKALFEGHAQVPTKGKQATQRFILGAVLLYQLILWYRFLHQDDLRRGLKPFLKAA